VAGSPVALAEDGLGAGRHRVAQAAHRNHLGEAEDRAGLEEATGGGLVEVHRVREAEPRRGPEAGRRRRGHLTVVSRREGRTTVDHLGGRDDVGRRVGLAEGEVRERSVGPSRESHRTGQLIDRQLLGDVVLEPDGGRGGGVGVELVEEEPRRKDRDAQGPLEGVAGEQQRPGAGVAKGLLGVEAAQDLGHAVPSCSQALGVIGAAHRDVVAFTAAGGAQGQGAGPRGEIVQGRGPCGGIPGPIQGADQGLVVGHGLGRGVGRQVALKGEGHLIADQRRLLFRQHAQEPLIELEVDRGRAGGGDRHRGGEGLDQHLGLGAGDRPLDGQVERREAYAVVAQPTDQDAVRVEHSQSIMQLEHPLDREVSNGHRQPQPVRGGPHAGTQGPQVGRDRVALVFAPDRGGPIALLHCPNGDRVQAGVGVDADREGLGRGRREQAHRDDLALAHRDPVKAALGGEVLAVAGQLQPRRRHQP
jgi:hypothetical protein